MSAEAVLETYARDVLHGEPTEEAVDCIEETEPKLIFKGSPCWTHDQIAAAITEDYGSPRYHTVIGAWRRRLGADKKLLKNARGIGYYVADDCTVVQHVSGEVRLIGERAVKAHNVNEYVDQRRLTAEDRRRWAHQRELTSRLHAAALLQPKAFKA